MTSLSVDTTYIPDDLKNLSQWVVWRAEPRDGRISKIPYRPDGRRASSTNPGDRTSFDNAYNAYFSPGPGLTYSGIGFVFSSGDGLCGVDLDHIVNDDGTIEPWADRIVRALDSYTEFSVSGKGLHVFCHGVIPDGKGHRRGQLEIYDRSRYFTVSGRIWGEPKPVRDAQSVITSLLHWMTRETVTTDEQPKKPCKPPYTGRRRYLPDRELLQRAAMAKNGYKFARLWKGDTSDYGNDDSRADLALLAMLAYWCYEDFERVDSLFRQSGLMRDKWDKRPDYRRRCFDRLRGRRHE
jgi:primase-polymerase (primpol)-like protein